MCWVTSQETIFAVLTVIYKGKGSTPKRADAVLKTLTASPTGEDEHIAKEYEYIELGQQLLIMFLPLTFYVLYDSKAL